MNKKIEEVNETLAKRLPDTPEDYRWRVVEYANGMLRLCLDKRFKNWWGGYRWETLDSDVFRENSTNSMYSLDGVSRNLYDKHLKTSTSSLIGVTKV